MTGTAVAEGSRTELSGARIAVWLLVAAGVAHFVLNLATAGVFTDYPINYVTKAAGAAVNPASFFVAAGVILGAGRWPASRTWLLVGAAILVVHGVLDLALDAWLGIRVLQFPSAFSDFERTFLTVRGWVSLIAGLVGYAAIGGALLLLPRQRVDASGVSSRVRFAAALGLLALVGAVGVVLQPYLALQRYPELTLTTDYAVQYVLMALLRASIGLVGVAAILRLPGRFLLPELLIAIGAALAVAGAAFVDWFFGMAPLPDTPAWVIEWGAGAATVVLVLGLLTMALGFGLGRVSARDL